jgi:hypothetical protein
MVSFGIDNKSGQRVWTTITAEGPGTSADHLRMAGCRHRIEDFRFDADVQEYLTRRQRPIATSQERVTQMDVRLSGILDRDIKSVRSSQYGQHVDGTGLVNEDLILPLLLDDEVLHRLHRIRFEDRRSASRAQPPAAPAEANVIGRNVCGASAGKRRRLK